MRTAELGIADGAAAYGHSLVGTDVVVSNLATLSTVNDTNAYPATTTNANGGIDLVSLNGTAFRTVAPEPSAFTAAPIGLGLVVTPFAHWLLD